MKKVLVFAAHPDDEILGVGGTIAKHVIEGDECYVVILGEGITSRYDFKENKGEEEKEALYRNTFLAKKVIGYNEIYFEKIPDNRFDSVDILDIIKIVEKYIEMIKPDIIYTHYLYDLNVDHRITCEAVMTASRPIGKEYVKEIYCFNTLSSTEWNFSSTNKFSPNYFIDIKSTIDTKIKAMECYKDEIREFPHPRSIEAIEAQARIYGSIISKEYSEAFEVMRIIK